MKPNFNITTTDINESELILVARQCYVETYPNIFTEEEISQLFITGLAGPNAIIIAAKQDNKIIGYAKVVLEDNELSSLDKLYVLKQYQRQEAGVYLLKECFQQALHHGKTKMKVLVFDTNLKVVSFYQKFGFSTTGERIPYLLPDGYYSGNDDHVFICDNMSACL